MKKNIPNHNVIYSVFLVRKASGCPDSTFKCFEAFVEFKCIAMDRFCDGVIDCQGAFDEMNCGRISCFIFYCNFIW